MKLVLASASPRRCQLLREHGWTAEFVPALVEEVMPPHLTPAEMTLLNARRKATEVAVRRPEALVIGADTLVAFEGKPFGKPRDMEDAFGMLHRLCGHTHQVFTGVWLQRGAFGDGFIEVSHVTFRAMSDEEIQRYLAIVQPLDKAGAYAAQENALDLIQHIEGSRTNVIGLPMEALEAELVAWSVLRDA